MHTGSRTEEDQGNVVHYCWTNNDPPDYSKDRDGNGVDGVTLTASSG